MLLPVLTSIRTLTAVDSVTPRPSVRGAANALLSSVLASPTGSAIFLVASSRHRENPIGAGSSQGHANEAERCCLQGVALEFFSQVAGGKLTEFRCTIRPS